MVVKDSSISRIFVEWFFTSFKLTVVVKSHKSVSDVQSRITFG